MRSIVKVDYWSWSFGWVKLKKRMYNKKVRKLFKKWTKELMDGKHIE